MSGKSSPWVLGWQAIGAWSLRMVLIISLVFPGLGLPGLFGSRAHAQQATEPANENRPFSLAYVPRDAVAVLAARPATLLARPTMAPVRDLVVSSEVESWFDQGIRLEDIAEFALVLLPTPKREPSAVMIVRTLTKDAIGGFIDRFGPDTQRETFAGQEYFKQDLGTCYFQPDERTVIFSSYGPALKRCIAAGTTGATSTRWADKWRSVAKQDVAAVVNTSLLRLRGVETASQGLNAVLPHLKQVTSRYNIPRAREMAFRLAPLWQRSEYVVAELLVTPHIALRVVSQSASAEEADRVLGAALTARSLTRDRLSATRYSAAEKGDSDSAALFQTIDLIDELLENAQVAKRDAQVGLLARADVDTTKRLAALGVPAMKAARDAGRRPKSLNNLKQLALAFHNYHDTFKTFPAATQIGPKNIPHSWRVTLLPYLENGPPLYDQYRQDEPWDSENNLKVLANMPDVFRCPYDRHDSTNTSYFALVGPEAVFDGNKGSRFADIRDGTSNTLLVVESKREVPWTKPEDVPFDSREALPQLGGWYPTGFSATLCDGSARFIPQDIDPQMLKYLIMRADGNPVQLPMP